MLKENGKDEIKLDQDIQIDSLRDYININIKLYHETNSGEIISLPIKLQNKLETELGDPIEGITGTTFALFKFFHKSHILNGDKFLNSYPDVKEGMTIIGAAGFSKPYCFKRFKKPYEYPYWGYYGNTIDAIAFVPNKPVIFYGFVLYATDQPQFQVKYKIYVNDSEVEAEELTLSGWEDKYYKK